MGHFEIKDIGGFIKKAVDPKYVREVAENLEGLRAPIHTEHLLDADKILEALIPESVRKTLIEGSADFLHGEMYEHLEIVGRPEDGRVHPHEFLIRRVSDDALEIFFVDPEHTIGRDNLLVPAVNNLMTARIYADGRDPEVAVLRHKTERLVAEHPLHGGLEKINYQTQAAQKLLDRDGIPEYLESFQDQILFRLVVKREQKNDRRPKLGIVQSIFSTPQDLQRFFDNNLKPNDAIDHKMQVERIIFERFARYMREGRFVKADGATKKRIGL